MKSWDAKRFGALVRNEIKAIGGRASAEAVWLRIKSNLTSDELAYLTEKQGVAQVGSALRRVDGDTGLPFAPHVGETYAVLEQLTIPEFAYLIVDHSRRRDAEAARVAAYQRRCNAIHNVWLDVEAAEELLDEESA